MHATIVVTNLDLSSDDTTHWLMRRTDEYPRYMSPKHLPANHKTLDDPRTLRRNHKCARMMHVIVIVVATLVPYCLYLIARCSLQNLLSASFFLQNSYETGCEYARENDWYENESGMPSIDVICSCHYATGIESLRLS